MKGRNRLSIGDAARRTFLRLLVWVIVWYFIRVIREWKIKIQLRDWQEIAAVEENNS